MPARPPLGLSVVVRDLNGAETIWWSGDRYAYNRPQNLSFATRRGNGFAEFSCTLVRDARLDWVDLNLLSDVTVVGDDGSILYEGRLMTTPRTFDNAQGSSITVTASGWMDYLNGRPFSEVYVGRNLGGWGEPGRSRRVNLLTALGTSYMLTGSSAVAPDRTNNRTGVVLELDRLASTASRFNTVEAWYDAGTVTLAQMYADVVTYDQAGATLADPGWRVFVGYADTDATTAAIEFSSDLHTGAASYFPASGTARKFALLQFYFAGASTADGPWQAHVRSLTVYGSHGLTLRGSTDPKGLYLSDILKNFVGRFYPKLSTAGVQDNTTLIDHFVCDKVTGFSAAQDLNKYALWQLSVFDKRTLYFYQADLTDYDFEVRLGEPGVSTTLQGDDANELRNGVVVVYQDVATGKDTTLFPTDYAQLRDDNPTNPANLAGDQRWGSEPFTLSVPCTQAMALTFGALALAQFNTPKEAGTVTLTGHARDRAGHWQPVSRIREGHRVAITNFPNARARLVYETSYDDDSRVMTLAVDNTFATIEALTARASLGLTAAGLI